MVENEGGRILSRIARAVYHRSPEKLRRSIKDVILRSLPSGNAKMLGPTVRKDEKPASQGASLIMTESDIGTTYDKEVVLPMLALENNALHTFLRESRNELEVSRRIAAENQDSAPIHGPNKQAEKASALADEFLAGQPDGPIRHLLIANEYPRKGREYGNGFIHQRVKRYLDAGVAVDIVCAGYSVDQELYEYDGVRVLTGHGQEIAEVLKRQTYTSVSVHFLNRRIWKALEPFLPNLDVHVFLHGYESSRWIRRYANYRNGRELERAIERSIDLQNFWHEVLHHPHQPKSYIFVSDWWRRAVYDDMRITFPPHRVHIVHNYINSDLFNYVPKEDDQRFNLLWIRSASSRTYANDIAIKVIERLAKSDYWERCKVTIIGDGLYFPEFEKKLGKYNNVHIEQRFITQAEIAEHHKTHGVFLVPSRLDSQGVSRDEAMSSGLVPVTNLVAAVPEFVDAESGIVAEPENAKDLAKGILEIWDDPERFQRLSKSAALRAREQSGLEATIERELRILGIGESTK